MTTAETVGQVLRDDLPEAVFKTPQKIEPVGSLQARKQATGAVALYWRYSIGTTSQRVLIGLYDSTAAPKSLTPTPKGYSIAAARAAAEKMATEHHAHRQDGGRPTMEAAWNAQAHAVDEAKRQASQYTLQRLLEDYADHLAALVFCPVSFWH